MTIRRNPNTWAVAIAVLLPVIVMAGAYIAEMLGLVACEMCWWQRWAHISAMPPAFAAAIIHVRHPAERGGIQRVLLGAAATAILTSGLIGVFHAGVEYHWWNGITACTASLPRGMSSSDFLKTVIAQPIIRCDVAQWTLLGVSLAGYNAILSIGGGLTVVGLIIRGGAHGTREG